MVDPRNSSATERMTEDEPRAEQRKPSLITFAIQRIRGPATRRKDLPDRDRRRLLQMCYLWPVTCCGVFLPVLVYLRWRADPDVGVHSKQGMLCAIGYTVFMAAMGIINGVAGRLAEDWVNVSLACGVLIIIVVVSLTTLGLRWYRAALRTDPVDIPFISAWAEYF